MEQDYYGLFTAGELAPLVGENMIPRFPRDSLCKRAVGRGRIGRVRRGSTGGERDELAA